MIQVLARKALQFANPNKALVNKKAQLGQPDQINMTTKLEEAFCRVKPNVVTAVPDWVKEDPIFNWCVADGDLMEVVVNSKGARGVDPVTGRQRQPVAGSQQIGDENYPETEGVDSGDRRIDPITGRQVGTQRTEVVSDARNKAVDINPKSQQQVENDQMGVDRAAQTKVDNLQARGQQQVAAQETQAKKAAHDKAVAQLDEKLHKMNKQQLLDYASENHDLELGPSLTKEDILTEIQKAQKEEGAAA
jgi:hypothetical protein